MANDELSNSQRIVRRAPITDIVVAYRSLQVEDLKRKKMRPGRKCGKGNYQRRVSSELAAF